MVFYIHNSSSLCRLRILPRRLLSVCMWQVYNQDSVVQSVLSSAVSTVMGSQGSLLGAGQLEVSPLLAGGAHLIDTWVELEV